MSKKKILIVLGAVVLVAIAFCGGMLFRDFMGFECPECAKCEKCDECVACPVCENGEKKYTGTIVDMDELRTFDVEFDFDVVESLDLSLAPIELAILGNYLLVVDGEEIWFDELDGYALYKNNIVGLSDETIKYLAAAMPAKDGECCSCCSDLKPGESCIAACCACAR